MIILIPMISFFSILKHQFFWLFLIFLLGACSTRKFNETVSRKKHSVEQLRSDVDLAYQVLKEGHPGLYWYISPEQLDKKFDSLKNAIQVPMSTAGFFKVFAPLITQIHCGHTQLLLVRPKPNKQEVAAAKKRGIKPIDQFRYTLLDNRLYILRNVGVPVPGVIPGTEITRIGDLPVAAILDTLKRMIPNDGYNTTYQPEVLNRNFAAYYKAYYVSKDTLAFTFDVKGSPQLVNVILSGGQKLTLKQEKISKEISRQLKEKRQEQAALKKKLRYRGLDENNKPLLDLNFPFKDSSTAYLKVKSFSSEKLDHRRFFRESFAEIARRGTQVLILDLRNNGGGSLNASRMLFSYLTDRDYRFVEPAQLNHRWFHLNKYADNRFSSFIFSLFGISGNEKEGYYAKLKGSSYLHANAKAFKGKVYVLINGYTFSAASLLAANLAGMKRAVFVGEESGGGYNQCSAGRMPLVEMPNSKLRLRLGIMRIVPATHRDLDGHGIFPDIPVSNTLENILSGKDMVLDTVLQEIRTTRNYTAR